MYSRKIKVAGWLIHLFTSSGAIIGVFTIQAIFNGNFQLALALLFLAMLVDTFDGFLARKIKVWEVIPIIDGKLLDLVIDFTNFVFVPAVFLYHGNLLPSGWSELLVALVVLTGCYNYGLAEDSTPDGYFIGFPAAWNFVCFYFITFDTSPWINATVVLILSILHFIPIKFIYLTKTRAFPHLTLSIAILWAISGIWAIASFGNVPQFILAVLIIGPIYMVALGIYATFSSSE